VRVFRANKFRNYDLPNEEEREKYKKQLGNWLETKKIVDPDTNI
jgi:hypothetical protein